jgi:hypothetical protein
VPETIGGLGVIVVVRGWILAGGLRQTGCEDRARGQRRIVGAPHLNLADIGGRGRGDAYPVAASRDETGQMNANLVLA